MEFKHGIEPRNTANRMDTAEAKEEADDISVGHGDAVGDHDDADNISDENGDDDEAAVPYIPPVCVVEGDPNLMSDGARQCTGLNSDDDSDADDEDDDEWEEDWEIGELSDEEPDPVEMELPDSLCLSVAKNASRFREMKESGWEYGTLCWLML
ncbi:hypothetical protein PI124_g12761 [Phytophthora idaei]|nr:hypothetical protein PI124_g12761 [Phytophthora idaei]